MNMQERSEVFLVAMLGVEASLYVAALVLAVRLLYR
jgi:hypothetical protein